MFTGQGHLHKTLTADEARALMAEGLQNMPLAGQRVLVILPDGTRSGPIPLMFRLFQELLAPHVAALDYLIALGTHMPMPEAAIHKLLGVTAGQMADE